MQEQHLQHGSLLVLLQPRRGLDSVCRHSFRMTADRGDAKGSTLQLLSSRAVHRRPVGIQHLPNEVLQTILVFSHSSALPVTCRHFRQAFHDAGTLVKAQYILGRWEDHLIGFMKGHPCRAKHKTCKSLTNRLAGRERHSDLARLEITDCTISLIQINHLDVISFAAELGITTAAILTRIVDVVATSLSLSLASCVLPPHVHSPAGTAEAVTSGAATGSNLSAPQLPKRLFRRIDQSSHETQWSSTTNETPQPASDDTRAKKRRRRRKENATETESQPEKAVDKPKIGQAWLSRLLISLAKEPEPNPTHQDQSGKRKHVEIAYSTDEEIQGRIGPVPSPDDVELIFGLLMQYGADASSHQGYPLAMAVHRRAYSLAHLLLLFGADPNCKEGLAVQIAIRNGSRDILHLLVTGPCLNVDALEALPLPAARLEQIGSRPFKLDQTHLRLAIQCRQWNLVDYIWHEQNISPDISCLRLIDKLRS
ncbi:Ankyrin repeat protein [Pseudozyma hubeiensis SY62]|uniref:Ankyrin repeat protein n=1 Tax=Pseudozyma hubeiensis (strain SY62) TaxID=1305764 RepID=R9P510_PSEHS|nr:Ankyrin repeat protein [Pseudozyma hubeiensis SY62]GAC96528.1 Ankyrin repeat protein [Pseudozyma hubeiensis SY62]